jgi:large subunit ribosomal protein L23
MKELTAVIRRPVVTERSTGMKAFNKYVFEVNPEANKTEIRQAVETMFRVQVLTVRTMAVRGKWTRRMGKTAGYTSHWKKAIVRLRPGQEIKAAQE